MPPRTTIQPDLKKGSSQMTGPILLLEDVNKYFGALHVLKDINLAVPKGQVLSIIGPSGAGKSTMCRAINRLEPISSGRILIDGQALPEEGRELARMRASIGMVFQSFNLFHHMNILDNVTIGPIKVRGMVKAEAEEHAMRLLDRVQIKSQAHKMPYQLSGGQQQRAAIARALAMEPKILLFDEPTSSLDPEMTREVLDVMRQLAEEGTTMIVVTHEMGFSRHSADRIVFMCNGAIVEDALPEEFFKAPASSQAKSFLATVLH